MTLLGNTLARQRVRTSGVGKPCLFNILVSQDLLKMLDSIFWPDYKNLMPAVPMTAPTISPYIICPNRWAAATSEPAFWNCSRG